MKWVVFNYPISGIVTVFFTCTEVRETYRGSTVSLKKNFEYCAPISETSAALCQSDSSCKI